MIFGLTKKRFYRLLAMLLILLIAPFAIEVVVLIDAVGIEATLAFLFLYGKSVAELTRDRLVFGYNLSRAVLGAYSGQDAYQHKVFAVGAGASLAILWLSGSVILSLVAWAPAVAELVGTV